MRRRGRGPAGPFLRRALAAALLAASFGATALADDGFPDWLAGLRAEAAARGVSAATLDAALTGLAPVPRVVELDRKQPERTMRFEQYLARVVTDSRVARGRDLFRRHRDLFARVGQEYGVPGRFVVALWGIETDFGRNTGGFDVIAALATLAHDGRRSAYFRTELLDALEILDQGHVARRDMRGSWAGAMGQCQFMPSSFLRHAVDYDGDGRRDIWGTLPDVAASAANYLKASGWDGRWTWGREVRLPSGFDVSLARAGAGAAAAGTERALGEWQRLGVRRPDGSDLPQADLAASLILPDGAGGRAFLVYANYDAVLRWNRSLYFATAVGLLADRIGR
ncbi:lytic murein transglycosylase [Arenibaculum sp.]|uniref:lytic murein transglycosylase n=1 Tax=Arenibaculum sp. TaxID=2865862 RepID=UPI002E15C237|nr:lytic murein transglycosylase [Arenibaculum sp.]